MEAGGGGGEGKGSSRRSDFCAFQFLWCFGNFWYFLS